MITKVENKFKEFGAIAFDQNVPIGFTSTSERFVLNYSLSTNVQFFNSLIELFEFVLNFKIL